MHKSKYYFVLFQIGIDKTKYQWCRYKKLRGNFIFLLIKGINQAK
jgi:hypothetical protein